MFVNTWHQHAACRPAHETLCTTCCLASKYECGDALQVVAYDFGIKHNIMRRLATHNCRITVVPAAISIKLQATSICCMQVVAYNFGIKHNNVRRLAAHNCRITEDLHMT